MFIKTIGVVGAGQMGSGIAQVFAMSDFDVKLYDISETQLKKAKQTIEKSLEKFVAKKTTTEEKRSKTLEHLQTTHTLQDLKNVSICIEAASEKLNVKSKIFKELDEFLPPESILATNTSSIPIGSLGDSTKRPDKVIGIHFMNPVPLMPCVEVIRSEKTSDATHQVALDLIKKIGKTPVTVKDAPGFVVNRILMPMINQAIDVVAKGLTTKEDVDIAMKLSCNFPMGPLTLADFIGLDTCLSILEVMGEKPSELLQKYVAEGKLGKKTGEGFYKY